MGVSTIAISGVSGTIGQAYLRHLEADGRTARVVGIDTGEPRFRPRWLDFRCVDVVTTDLAELLEGVEVLVHLAGLFDPDLDDAVLARVNLDGTRRLLDAAAAAGVRTVVLTSSVAVYGAWADNPVPLTEDASLRPNPGFALGVHKAENERQLREWRLEGLDRVGTVLRLAFVLGHSTSPVVAAHALGRAPIGVSSPPPVQFLHVEDAAAAIAHAVDRNLPGTYNVAADGWLSAEAVRAVVGEPTRRVALRPDVARRVLTRMWAMGASSVPPGMTPFLASACVVATDRLRATGWSPQHDNESALRACLETAGPRPSHRRPVVVAGVVAAVALAGLGRRAGRGRRLTLRAAEVSSLTTPGGPRAAPGA